MSLAKKVLISVGVAIGLLVSVFAVWLFAEGSTKPIVSVADQFKAPSSWELESENISGPSLSCISDTPCPYVGRTWLTNEEITREELQKIIDESGLDMTVEGDCLPSESYSSSTRCEAKANISGYSIGISPLNLPDSTKYNRVILTVRKAQ